MNTLTKASRQLFNRGADETFTSWGHILHHLRMVEGRTVEVRVDNIRAIPQDGRVYLQTSGPDSEFITQMNDWSFTQLSKLTGVRGARGTLNALHADTCVTAVNELLGISGANTVKRVAKIDLPPMAVPGEPVTQALYSPRYERVSDLEVFTHFHALSEQYGYEPAGEFAGKRGGLSPVRPEASGLYRGEQNSFGFVCNEIGKIDIEDSSLYHAVMWGNSEVGKETLWFQDVLYDFICGNHQIWGPKRHRQVKHKHTGNVRDVLHKATMMYQVVDIERDERRETIAAMHQQATRQQFATTRELVGKKLTNYLTKKDAAGVLPFLDHPQAYPKNPTSVWGVTSAITLFSQTKDFTDERLAIDRVAGNLIQNLGE